MPGSEELFVLRGWATGALKVELAGAVVTVLADCARAALNIADKAFCPALGNDSAAVCVPYPCCWTGVGAPPEISGGKGAGGGVVAIMAGFGIGAAGAAGATSGGNGAGATGLADVRVGATGTGAIGGTG
jgi:hypothetical protein